MVIVEYCKYGNLSSYLKSKRSVFIPFKVNESVPGLDNGHLTFGPMNGHLALSSQWLITISTLSDTAQCLNPEPAHSLKLDRYFYKSKLYFKMYVLCYSNTQSL